MIEEGSTVKIIRGDDEYNTSPGSLGTACYQHGDGWLVELHDEPSFLYFYKTECLEVVF